jgi:hypothetical protein
MTDDIVDELRKIERAGDIPPKGHPSLAGRAADEIERLRDMCINREEFIAQHNLWKEFGKYLSEPHEGSPVSSTDGNGIDNKGNCQSEGNR